MSRRDRTPAIITTPASGTIPSCFFPRSGLKPVWGNWLFDEEGRGLRGKDLLQTATCRKTHGRMLGGKARIFDYRVRKTVLLLPGWVYGAMTPRLPHGQAPGQSSELPHWMKGGWIIRNRVSSRTHICQPSPASRGAGNCLASFTIPVITGYVSVDRH